MDLVPVTKAETQAGAVVVDDERRKQIGLRTAKVVRAPMALEVRAVGRLTYDETRLKDVTLKWRGFITKLYVASTGQPVAKGQPLFAIYSPELYAAEREFLLALGARGREGGAVAAAEGLTEAARKKLLLWDLTPAQIDEIARKGAPLEQIDVRSPASGFVLEKNVVEGAAVEAGMRLYRIAALDRVWLEADVFEADLPHVHKGDRARITLPYLPGRELEGRVTYVYPFLNPSTRTGRVRVELPNKGLELKPDMYANVAIDVALGDRLQLPAAAVIYTGPRRVVFVDRGDDRLEPVDVKLGARAGDAFEVLGGVKDGDRVVTSGNFLVASESRLRSATREEDAGER
jgi:Cu(I)/Ag(I) efflux system membrane fusion protein